MKNVFKALIIIALILPATASGQDDGMTKELIGTWKLDMSPQDKTDDNFAMMRIEAIDGYSFTGTFYREGVALKNGQLNTQRGIVYGALVSGDNSGTYNSTFYLKDGKLYGTTHALDRNFLAVWIATKTKE